MEDTREINQLIRELNLGGEREARPEAERLDGWLTTLIERAGSDLLLVAGAPAAVRLDGRVTPLAEAPLSGEEIEDAVLPSLSSAARSRYLQDGAADASYKVRGLGRFRINLHHERGRAAATVRARAADPEEYENYLRA